MKNSNANVNKPEKIKEGQLRVWHKPQIPMNNSFYVYVKSVKEARLILDVLAIFDLFQFDNNIKPDYSNASGLEVCIDGEWGDWCDRNGNDIDTIKGE